MAKKRPKIIVLGGGTGSFTVLSGLRDYPVDLTAIISMADSGGSNRVLRDEFGILPTSDIRQCLVALADSNGDQQVLRDLFNYRFHQGRGIAGMTFGNLFMAALADIQGSQLKAIEETCRILNIKGQILPVTSDDVQLVARYENGHQVVGEHAIDEPKHDGKLKIIELETIPQAKAYPKAVQAIKEADLVIIGPGDLYTSVACNLIIKGIARALKQAGNRIISILGARSKDLLFWEDELGSVSDQLIVTTDDGTYGRKGLVTEPLKEILDSGENIGLIMAIGPVPMMKFLSKLTNPYEVPTWVSLNPLMVDGTGMCGGCRVAVGDTTKFACVTALISMVIRSIGKSYSSGESHILRMRSSLCVFGKRKICLKECRQERVNHG